MSPIHPAAAPSVTPELPSELWTDICRDLPSRDLAALTTSSRGLAELTQPVWEQRTQRLLAGALQAPTGRWSRAFAAYNGMGRGAPPSPTLLHGGSRQWPMRVAVQGAQAAATFDEGTLKLYDLHTQQVVRHWQPRNAWYGGLAMQGPQITTAMGRHVEQWDTRCAERQWALPEMKASVNALVLRDSVLGMGDSDGNVQVWETGARRCLTAVPAHDNVFSLALDPQGRWMASGGAHDRTIHVWDTQSLSRTQTLTGHTGSIFGLDIRDGQVFSGCTDRSARLWDATTGQQLLALPHPGWVDDVERQGDTLVTAGHCGLIKLWDAPTGTLRGDLAGHDPNSLVTRVSLYNNIMLSVGHDHRINLWRFPT